MWKCRCAADALAERPGVLRVERDQLMHLVHHQCGHTGGPPGSSPPPDCPDDPGDEPEDGTEPENGNGSGESTQVTPWVIDKIEAPAAWATTQGAGASVCVADTGIDKNHEDLDYVLGRNFTGGGPFSNPENDKYDDGNGHGTHVSGTVAALDNDLGVVGVAPHADLYIAKVLGDNGSGWVSQIANGPRWCADQEVHVINMSFGGGDSSTLHGAIQYAAERGVVLVAASGNSGASQPGFPARYDEVIAVGATNQNDVIASWSNRGEEVNAPGVGVLSTVAGGYDTYSGTSMASPHVAGVAALIIATGVTDAEAVRETISSAADDITGGIRVNADSAVAASVTVSRPPPREFAIAA